MYIHTRTCIFLWQRYKFNWPTFTMPSNLLIENGLRDVIDSLFYNLLRQIEVFNIHRVLLLLTPYIRISGFVCTWMQSGFVGRILEFPRALSVKYYNRQCICDGLLIMMNSDDNLGQGFIINGQTVVLEMIVLPPMGNNKWQYYH